MSIYAKDERICFVNCGLPGDQCACFRAMQFDDMWAGNPKEMPKEHLEFFGLEEVE